MAIVPTAAARRQVHRALPLSRKPGRAALARRRAVLDSADSNVGFASDAGPGDRRRSDGRIAPRRRAKRATRSPCTGLAGLQERVGQEIGTSSWRTVEQDDIDTFAKLTGDEQWIHVDPERAADRARSGPPCSTAS